jgi:uncharacterized damage-inducible protein DinB
MTTVDITTVPPFYQNYVKQVMELDVFDALKISRDEMNKYLASLPPEQLDYAYAPGKWTIKELLCHIIDAERIFTYRALCFSRNDKTNLPGFDENSYVPESNATQRTIFSIRNELNNLRTSTIDFFESCSPAMLERKGMANNTELSVLTLGYVVSGHEVHHLNILKERYFQL